MKVLVKNVPDGFIKSVNDEISSILNRNFDSYFPECIDDLEKAENMAIPVELYEKEGEYVVKAELPGIAKENLDIDLEKDHITINAKKYSEEESADLKKSEFRYGEFSRAVYFPMEIDVDKTSAKLEHGVLTVLAKKLTKEEKGIRKLVIE